MQYEYQFFPKNKAPPLLTRNGVYHPNYHKLHLVEANLTLYICKL